MGQLILASNRTTAGEEKRAGGLAVALWDALVERDGGLWFGWSGDVVSEATRGIRLVNEEGVDFALADLTQQEHDGYYLGFANRAVWPVFHYRVDLADFNEHDFNTYLAVNRRFARLLFPLTADEDVLWVHDYHFFFLAEELRRLGWNGKAGFFLHIPFPAPEIFKALPEHQQIARGLACYDLVGFQTNRDVENFKRYLLHECNGIELDDGRIRVFGKDLNARAFPIGIDCDEIARFAVEERGREASARLERFLGDRALIIGVDRMDYSKGLPQRMEAVGRLLDEFPELHERLSFTQIAPPSRSQVNAYAELRATLDQMAGRINGDYGDLDWIPIRYLARTYSREELAGIYRLADVALVTPLYDGMNLVAKEFIAAQDPEDPGVLILSEFAGAAEEMQAAMIVNPHDVVAMVDAIKMALEMPLEERRSRWQALEATLRHHDLAWWRRSFLAALTGDMDGTPLSGSAPESATKVA